MSYAADTEMHIAVTGSNGFVGRQVCNALRAAGHLVRPIVRMQPRESNGEWFAIGTIDGATEWEAALRDIDCVVHCAARVHVLNDSAASPLDAFRAVNAEGTENLAQQAAIAGVKRFIFLSSLKVLGEGTSPGKPFSHESIPQPVDPYGISKWEGEMTLKRVHELTGLETVVIRPPLVYGPGVRANFLALLQAVARGIPLPFGDIKNKRSLIGLSNLCDVVTTCIDHPHAAGHCFLVSDGLDVSTPELVRSIGLAMGKNARIVTIPLPWLTAAGRLTGKQRVIDRLCGSLQVDIGHTIEVLGWTPKVTLEQELQKLILNL